MYRNPPKFKSGSKNPILENDLFMSSEDKIIEKILNIKSKKKMLTLQKGDMVKTYSNSTKIFKLFKCVSVGEDVEFFCSYAK